MSSFLSQLQGTGVALVTPFSAQGFIDFAALANIIEHVISGGAEYVVTLGTTGETPTLDKFEKTDVVKFTFEKVNGRVPVVVGIGGNNTKDLLKDLQNYPLENATAILSASPYYSKPSQEGLYQHYKALAEASPKPILLYNVPGRTGRNLTAETTIRLAKEVSNIAGIKEASGDMGQCIQILRHAPKDFLVVSGDDALALPQIACGMKGVISVAANAYPRAFSDMVRFCLDNDFAKAKTINDTLVDAYNLMFEENNPAGVKAFMTEMGLLKNNLRLPLVPLSDGVYNKIKAFLATR
ncbi:4-hydroxy-tetrahydrodipicolinate synthase [Panacibacter sp. DH6]|uniref:4-hydroxy-tetrahydrodipicolinate synthase n=1 Tax=Panacibacter microcysteis TaxID=2793269 RepID=A0A931H059_9BACT|nr:4-hydroxy-tetrahydrodipicolinate synthase [Panacibacter microcysteis]MBG9378568.1 4-hydroxy-tetrahydrodipicolinate synthase [Panacibacter microcysteis]